MPPVLIQSTDPGTPVLSGLAGSLCNGVNGVLDYCLPLAGWALRFVGAQVAAYQQGLNPAVPGYLPFYVQIQDDASAGPNPDVVPPLSCVARLSGYETMTAISVGTNAMIANNGPFPRDAFVYVCKSFLPNATPVAWLFIGDAYTWYFCAFSLDAYNNPTVGPPSLYCRVGFGDYLTAIPGFLYNKFIAGRINGDNTYNAIPGDGIERQSAFSDVNVGPTTANYFLARDAAGVTVSIKLPHVMAQGGAAQFVNGFQFDGMLGNFMLPVLGGGPYFGSMPLILEPAAGGPNAVFNFGGTDQLQLLGQLRGVVSSLQDPGLTAGVLTDRLIVPSAQVQIPGIGSPYGKSYIVVRDLCDPTINIVFGSPGFSTMTSLFDMTGDWNDPMGYAGLGARAMGNRSVIHMGSP